MSQFFDIAQHEFKMSIRRKGFWIAYLLLSVFYGITLFAPSPMGDVLIIHPEEVWTYAGQIAFMFNMLMPLAGGILAADRMQRDFYLQIHELQQSTPVTGLVYILGKYFGVLGSILLPIFLWVVTASLLAIPLALAPFSFLGAMLVAFISMSVPACAFVVAFSLACPLVMPVRVYQILFTGYWFWGNYLNPNIFPTLSGTILTPGGRFVLEAFFGAFINNSEPRYSAPEAIANLLILGLCIAMVIFVLNRYLAWQAQRA